MLQALVALYKIDRDLHTLETGLDNVQRDQKRQTAKIAEMQKSHDSQFAVMQKVQADQSGRELELKTRQEHIDKMRESLNTTKTNKEYSAILLQISAEKAEVATIEKGVLELMQTVETAQKSIADLKTQIAAETATLAKIESEQAGKVGDLQGQINTLKGRRAEAASAVAPDALRVYDRASQKYPGDALAPLEYDPDDLDSCSCGCCYMGLNTEHLNALKGRDEVRRCNSCNRILYLPEMLGAVTAPAH
jgi:predicted  nucleic acid-binding Zn-ribbon protein